MDPGAISGVALNKYRTATHCVAARIADVTSDNDPSFVHRVSDGILSAAVDNDLRSVQVRSERVSRGAVQRNFYIRCSGGNKPLPCAAVDNGFRTAAAQRLIDLSVPETSCVNYHYTAPPNLFLRISALKI